MVLVGLIIWLAIGAIAGWPAGQFMKGGGYGLLGDIIVGIVGGAIAGYLLPAAEARNFHWWKHHRGDHQCDHRRLPIALRHSAGQTLTIR